MVWRHHCTLWPWWCNRSLCSSRCLSRARETIEVSYKLRQWLLQHQQDSVSLMGHLQQQLASLDAPKLCRVKEWCHLEKHLDKFAQLEVFKNHTFSKETTGHGFIVIRAASTSVSITLQVSIYLLYGVITTLNILWSVYMKQKPCREDPLGNPWLGWI